MIYFTNVVLNLLRQHAEQEYPAECCGVLAGMINGEHKTVCRIYPVSNSAESNRSACFCIDPLEIVRVESCAEQERLEIVGFYHSHPDHAAIVSQEDARFMIPGYSYPIISVRNGNAVEIRCYVRSDDTSLNEEPVKRRDTNADNSLCCGNAANLCE